MVQANQNYMHAMTWFTAHMTLYTHRIYAPMLVVSKEYITCLEDGVKCTQIVITAHSKVEVMLITYLYNRHHLWVKLTHSDFTNTY